MQTLAPMFAPVVCAMLAKLRSKQHWHADEIRWALFVPVEGKIGHRWYLWGYHSPSVVHYGIDASRWAQVVEDELGEVTCGSISGDRYSVAGVNYPGRRVASRSHVTGDVVVVGPRCFRFHP